MTTRIIRLIALLIDLACDDAQRPRPARRNIGWPNVGQRQPMQPDRRARVPAPAPGVLAWAQEGIEQHAVHTQRQPRVGRGRVGELDRLMLGDMRQLI